MDHTDSLGDFMNSLPVLKGIYNSYGKYDLIIKGTNRKFRGFKEMLEYQGIFNSVSYEDEAFTQGALPFHIPNDYSEKTDNPNRPAETCRWDNVAKSLGLVYEVEDSVELKYPDLKLDFDRNRYVVGDRWNGPGIDHRRSVNNFANLTDDKFLMLDFNNDMLTNLYIIKESQKPFIGSFTGCSVLANLLNKEMMVVWKKEIFAPQFWRGDDIFWDGGKNIQQTFERHFYTIRNCKLVHERDLGTMI
jgi:hypothetical protein